MTNWITSRWAALDTWGRIGTSLLLAATVLNTITLITNPTIDHAQIAVFVLATTFFSAEANYWREQALNWCAMNDLARTIAHALDHNRDVLISTGSNGNDTVVVIDREGTTP